MKKIVVVNVRVPSEIVDWIDSLVGKELYNSRSDAVRELTRVAVLKERIS